MPTCADVVRDTGDVVCFLVGSILFLVGCVLLLPSIVTPAMEKPVAIVFIIGCVLFLVGAPFHYVRTQYHCRRRREQKERDRETQMFPHFRWSSNNEGKMEALLSLCFLIGGIFFVVGAVLFYPFEPAIHNGQYWAGVLFLIGCEAYIVAYNIVGAEMLRTRWGWGATEITVVTELQQKASFQHGRPDEERSWGLMSILPEISWLIATLSMVAFTWGSFDFAIAGKGRTHATPTGMWMFIWGSVGFIVCSAMELFLIVLGFFQAEEEDEVIPLELASPNGNGAFGGEVTSEGDSGSDKGEGERLLPRHVP
eukprot:TRINITY_DN103726_c0_g1_i1.p1 TRINITY_DN103726_c0_g1~~TRINITY_DN103726_c0_g1_i1.p1  ORF type:complete len:310 (-),score=29.10 TRINITY_DN103726_c0_g1_i1:47-976(-)